MGRKQAKGQCPDGRPHHWMIDNLNHGVCILCKTGRDFPEGSEYSHTKEVSRKGGQAKRRLARRVPALNI